MKWCLLLATWLIVCCSSPKKCICGCSSLISWSARFCVCVVLFASVFLFASGGEILLDSSHACLDLAAWQLHTVKDSMPGCHSWFILTCCNPWEVGSAFHRGPKAEYINFQPVLGIIQVTCVASKKLLKVHISTHVSNVMFVGLSSCPELSLSFFSWARCGLCDTVFAWCIVSLVGIWAQSWSSPSSLPTKLAVGSVSCW